jgi:hypothetical protein
MMMLLPCPESQQDNIPVKNVTVQDSVRPKSDSASVFSTLQLKDSVPRIIKSSPGKTFVEISDTISLCKRNNIEDVTFYDSHNLVTRIESIPSDKFPFLFIYKNRHIQEVAKTSIVKHLRAGSEIHFIPYHDDWIIFVILAVTFLFTLIRKSSDSFLQGVKRFFLFRGVNDPSSRDIAGLFNWESTIKNLMSFLILGLFGYSVASYYNIIPSAITGIIFWIVSVMIIISAVTVRHFVCFITGIISDEKDVFREYLVGVYQHYRFSAFFIFVLIILMSYTNIFTLKSCFIAGIIVFATLYLMRIIRLLVIFINRNISLFYLILYLCALEILPGLISVKYISGFNLDWRVLL